MQGRASASVCPYFHLPVKRPVLRAGTHRTSISPASRLEPGPYVQEAPKTYFLN